ncbi:GAF and ANTAR domain-containing protein [Streptomyces sp. NPDC005209]|uniref:GAF and ANTAR domain-containing protein n=1 Tax=Streptomyces sp. NPDC005209 TaxID=3156715 RepID=UPI0033BE3327
MSQEPEGKVIPLHDSSSDREEQERLRQQNAGLRNRMLARTSISAAQGVLLERYRLPSLGEAFDLLRHTSQRHNVKLHTLADAVLRTPGPDRDAHAWFPRRVRTAPPPLTGLARADHNDTAGPAGAVLGAALDRVLDITQTPMGNVQLAENGLLRMEKHTGLNRRFVDHFTFVDGPGTSCGRAAENRRQVTVRDVAAATVFDEESRRVILHAGSRACHSVPLLDERGAPLGVISSHHPRPLGGFTRAQLDALETTGAVVGRWLSWHRRTVIRDALEDLHATAQPA